MARLQLTPAELKLPDRYKTFRSVQESAILAAYETFSSGKQYHAACAPVGCGKSLIAMAVHKILGGRVLILTQDRGLQDQYKKAFIDLTEDIRGRKNYKCNMYYGDCDRNWEDCGSTNSRSAPHCRYLKQVNQCLASECVVTNYAYALSAGIAQLGKFDLIVADEAHLIERALDSYMELVITDEHCEYLGMDVYSIKNWSVDNTVLVFADYNPKSKMHRDYEIEQDLAKLKTLLKSPDNLCVDEEPKHKHLRFRPVWIGGETWRLFGNTPTLLMSGTLRKKTMGLYGIAENKYDFVEYPWQFNTQRCPVYAIPTADMTARALNINPSLIYKWINRSREIARPRSRDGWNGVFHTGSFDRTKLAFEALSKDTALVDKLITNANQPTKQAVEMFTAMAGSGALLISPSVTTGYDFIGDMCRYVLVGKIPFPLSGDALLKRRLAKDKSYSSYQAAQTLVQSSFRGMRDEKDWCEVFIIDDTWFKWFGRQCHSMELVPKYFNPKTVEQVPVKGTY